MEIRKEIPEDQPHIFALNKAAFKTGAEARLVDEMRASDSLAVSLVAVEDGAVIGHIAFSPMTFGTKSACRAAGLAPLAVAGPFRNRGVGGALISAGLAEMKRLGYDAVFVLGCDKYYPRFGFRRAADLGLGCLYPDAANFFFVTELRPGGLNGATGLVEYAPEFARL